MLDDSQIMAQVKNFVMTEFLPDENPDDLTSDTPLVTGGILDSIATLKLVSFLEEHFGISVAAHEVDAQNLDSLDLITALVRSKLG
jgi:acyl carrier protein